MARTKYTAQEIRDEVHHFLAIGEDVRFGGHGTLHSPFTLDVGPFQKSYRVTLHRDGKFRISSRGDRGAATMNRTSLSDYSVAGRGVDASGVVVEPGTTLAQALRAEVDFHAPA